MSRADWIVARASGLSALVLLSAAMVLGLLLALRYRSDRWPRAVTNDLHRFVTSLALWMTGLHLLMLVVNAHAGISLVDLVVPFTTADRPVANGVGVLAVYALAAVAISTAYRSRLDPARWRRLHQLAFVAYVAAMGHGLFAGTDTSRIWAWPVYAGSAIVVGRLTWRRATGRTFEAPPAEPAKAMVHAAHGPVAVATSPPPPPIPEPEPTHLPATRPPDMPPSPDLPPLPPRSVARRRPIRL